MENGFGIMASRFRIFSRPIICDPDKAVLIVKACVALHNFLSTTERAAYIPGSFEDSSSSTGEDQPGEWRQLVQGDNNLVDGPRHHVDRATRRAGAVREQFNRYFQSEAGMLPNQDRVLQVGRVLPRAPE